MNDDVNRSQDMLIRVKDYGATHAADFPANSLGGEVFAEVAAAVAAVEHHATVQTTHAARLGSVNKAAARAALQERLRAINRTARAMVMVNPALKNKFRLPRPGDQALLNGARAFLEQAEPLVAEFVKHEMPPDFLIKLKSEIEAFQAAVTEQNQNKETRVKATATVAALVASAVKAVHRLDPIVRNKYANDKPNLAAWESASHIERHNTRSKDQAKTDPPKTDQGKGDLQPILR